MRSTPKDRSSRSDREDHQNLGRDRLDEPARLKQRLASAEQIKQNIECKKIKHGADWPKYQHEAFDELDVPFHRSGDSLFINLIERDRNLRDVVEKVVQQYLDRKHRQERPEQCRPGHAEHVAKIRT